MEVVALLIVLAAIGWGIYLAKYAEPKPVAYEVAGPIEKVEGSTIFMNAVFKAEDGTALNGEHIPVRVLVTATTNIVKTEMQLPSDEELAASGGYYQPAKLPQVNVAGTLADIASGRVDGVFVKAATNIYGRTQFEAAEVRYIDAR